MELFGRRVTVRAIGPNVALTKTGQESRIITKDKTKTNSDSDPHECDAEIYNIVKYLIFAYVLMVVPTFLLVIHYSITVQKIYYMNNHYNKYEKRAQNNVDVELDSISNKKLTTTVPE